MAEPAFCLPVDVAEELLYEEESEFDGSTLTAVGRETIRDARWESHRILVFRKDGELYGFHFVKGLTEMQDSDPFSYEEVVKVYPAYGVEKTITEYGLRD